MSLPTPRRLVRLHLTLGLLVVFALAGCGDDDDPIAPTDTKFVLRVQQGYQPTSAYDGCRYVQISPSSQDGGNSTAYVGVLNGEESRVLTAFYGLQNLLPPDVAIERAFVQWTLNGQAGSEVRVQAFALSEDWNGNATWSQRFQSQTDNPWATPGGAYDPTVLDEVEVEDGDSQFVIELPPALVENWIREWRTNRGIILIAPEVTPGSVSSQAVPLRSPLSGGLAPVLTLVYSL